MDKILVTMPESPREFFLAMPVIQDYIFQYVQEVHKGLRDKDFRFTFRMNDVYERYEAPLKVARDVVPNFDYSGWSEKRRGEFNNFIDFDFEAAKRIASQTGKHITEGLGILIGSSPKKWPILPSVTSSERILICNWNTMEEAVNLQRMIGNGTDAVNLSEQISMDDIDTLDVETVSAVIGPSSVITHLAASYHRKVIEIFSDIKSYIWYNSEGIYSYQAIIGNPTAEQVMKAWENLSIETLEGMEDLSA